MSIRPLLVTAADAAKLIGRSERGFHDLRHTPGFPPPVDLGGARYPRWRVADLEAWVAALPATETRSEPPQLRRGRLFRDGKPVKTGTAEA